jgi:hypothetical protein
VLYANCHCEQSTAGEARCYPWKKQWGDVIRGKRCALAVEAEAPLV